MSSTSAGFRGNEEMDAVGVELFECARSGSMSGSVRRRAILPYRPTPRQTSPKEQETNVISESANIEPRENTCGHPRDAWLGGSVPTLCS